MNVVGLGCCGVKALEGFTLTWLPAGPHAQMITIPIGTCETFLVNVALPRQHRGDRAWERPLLPSQPR